MGRYEIVQQLHKKGFYKMWPIKKMGPIIFHIYPGLKIKDIWFKKRSSIYQKNAKILGIKKIPKVNFYIYPDQESGEKLGFQLGFSFSFIGEIHSRVNQTPGHELTHILIKSLNHPKNLPAGGLWSEGLATYLNGDNKKLYKKYVKQLISNEEILNRPWDNWKQHIPDSLYPLTASIIQYLVQKYKWSKTLSFIKQIKNLGDNQNEISIQIFKKPLVKVQEDWIQWIKHG